jgi:hypothetical protein
MSLSDDNLCCYKERGCYPGWGFSGGTPGSSGRVSSSLVAQTCFLSLRLLFFPGYEPQSYTTTLRYLAAVVV